MRSIGSNITSTQCVPLGLPWTTRVCRCSQFAGFRTSTRNRKQSLAHENLLNVGAPSARSTAAATTGTQTASARIKLRTSGKTCWRSHCSKAAPRPLVPPTTPASGARPSEPTRSLLGYIVRFALRKRSRCFSVESFDISSRTVAGQLGLLCSLGQVW